VEASMPSWRFLYEIPQNLPTHTADGIPGSTGFFSYEWHSPPAHPAAGRGQRVLANLNGREV
jgi:hypothetical protein